MGLVVSRHPAFAARSEVSIRGGNGPRQGRRRCLCRALAAPWSAFAVQVSGAY